MYELLQRLVSIEMACNGAGSIMWAHSLERLWFEYLDLNLPKEAFRAVIGQDTRGACFLGANARRTRR